MTSNPLALRALSVHLHRMETAVGLKKAVMSLGTGRVSSSICQVKFQSFRTHEEGDWQLVTGILNIDILLTV